MNLENINLNGIDFGIYRDGPVGISVSCGADSAIILYLLMKEVKHDLHIYNLIGESRKETLEPAIDKVVQRCSELTGKTNYFVHKFYAPRPPVELIFNIYKERLELKEVDIIYTGLTKFPPDSVWESWGNPGPQWHVNWRHHDNVHPLFGLTVDIPEGTNCKEPPLTVDGSYKSQLKQDDRVYNPMINHHKQGISQLYKALSIEQELFPYTRSCEDDEHPDSHCGKCWWCRERLWGFGYLE